MFLQLDLQDTNQREHAAARLSLFFAYSTIAVHSSIIHERIEQAIERSRQILLPIVQAVIESDPARFRHVTLEGFVAVLIGIAQGCALQFLLLLLRDRHVDAEHILTVVYTLLIPS